MKNVIFAFFSCGIFLPTIYCRQLQFYRHDYTYIEELDAFYKIHWNVSGSDWGTALFTCDDEGATLFYPKSEEEWTIVKNLTNKINNDKGQNVTQIFLGLHDESKSRDFIAVDEHTTPDFIPPPSNLLQKPHYDNCMTMNLVSGLPNVSSCMRTNHTAFVCKKVDSESCPTIDRAYKYRKASKKCYKVNEKTVRWEKALETCSVEGGILAVIEDRVQALDLQSMLTNGLNYFVGVRQLDSRDGYYSVKGQKFSQLYQQQYNTGAMSYDCVSVQVYNSMLVTNSLSCEGPAPFICEMDSDRITTK